ncbi:hypothetical protein GRI89_01315 [Altererythrobacter salegens]|uniref:Lipoprotein n=1 Tax=Croceibacterium salegens TaxID=1737568 RepID=A0A6I4SQT0_9SPHN|nr:hypothetical protein [Croceibacterium salegens]MXO58184.1 hypothetical protein [Croceibacterium salegens]
MIGRLPILAVPAVAVLALVACSEQEPPTPAETATATPAPAPTGSPTPAAAGGEGEAALAPPLVPEAEKGEKGARNVLLTWARALENHQFAEAYAQFGPDGPPDGLSPPAYAAQFGRCRKITVAMPTGTMEGAAGSQYYTAPTTLTCELVTGTSEQWKGDVILRRINDIPGATPEQLRWHIESAEVTPSG